jgi:hypothetical protein
MKLLTDDLIKRFKELGCQYAEADYVIPARFYDSLTGISYYPINYDPELNVCHGIERDGKSDSWKYFNIEELESDGIPSLGIGVKRDDSFKECHFSDLKIEIDRYYEEKKTDIPDSIKEDVSEKKETEQAEEVFNHNESNEQDDGLSR